MSDFDSARFLKTLSSEPGVYRMLDSEGQVIYVGKAKNLKKRVTSYFRSNVTDSKTRVLVSNICGIEVTLTNTETEALLLENNLIKKYQPRYNILLRDDKSYPYILLTDHKHRDSLFIVVAVKSKASILVHSQVQGRYLKACV